MKTNIKYIFSVLFLLLFVVTSCTEDNYSFGNLTAPNNIVINAVIVGKDATHPDGDGSGKVIFSITGDNILGASIDYDDTNALDPVILSNVNSATYTYINKTDPKISGVYKYRVTVVASGVGGTSTNATKDISVYLN
ncbi:MAG: hypothetical protein JHC39_05070 [Lentimicrobium sp.]|jgi:hypothetical protein|nr:hypothetical protein [Lentimicrobium sp.]